MPETGPENSSTTIGLYDINAELSSQLSIEPNSLAKFIDYYDRQGGVPVVNITDRGLTRISHLYSKDPIIVESHKSVIDYGIVPHSNSKGIVKNFSVALLREHHGDPCEKESIKHGGKGYERHKK